MTKQKDFIYIYVKLIRVLSTISPGEMNTSDI